MFYGLLHLFSTLEELFKIKISDEEKEQIMTSSASGITLLKVVGDKKTALTSMMDIIKTTIQKIEEAYRFRQSLFSNDEDPDEIHIVANITKSRHLIKFYLKRADKLPILMVLYTWDSIAVGHRLVATKSGISLRKIITGDIPDEDWPALINAATSIASFESETLFLPAQTVTPLEIVRAYPDFEVYMFQLPPPDFKCREELVQRSNAEFPTKRFVIG